MKSSESQSALIFICYRHADVGGYSKLVFSGLNEVFKEKVFRDRGGIKGGDDFAETLQNQLDSCVVLIALIGSTWLDSKDAAGKRRLDDPEDFVCREIETALRRGIKVIPVLIGEANMPLPEQLPEQLQGLTRRQSLRLVDEDWDSGMERLTDSVRKELVKFSGDGGRIWAGLGRAWSRIVGPLWRGLAQALKKAPLVIPTLVVPNAFIIWASTQWVASYYRQFGRVEYIITDPATYVQLALLQSVAVCVYSGLWLAASLWLRRRREAKRTAAGTDQPQNTPRTE